MKNEKWKPVLGYKGKYEVSNKGRVRSLNYKCTGKVKVLKSRLKSNGYLDVELCKEGKKKKFYVHRLTFEGFHGPIPPGLTVDHINGVKSDNRLENLQLLSSADNTRKSCNKQLDLMEAEYPFRELTFSSSYEASEFFRYKDKKSVGVIIYQARKRERNFINLRGTKYFFSQAD